MSSITVAEFAQELKKTPETLLDQLKSAGVAKAAPSDALTEAGVNTRDDLADLAVDELTEITGHSADDAKALILKAREHWFAGQE